jgi:hypothetical protein
LRLLFFRKVFFWDQKMLVEYLTIIGLIRNFVGRGLGWLRAAPPPHPAALSSWGPVRPCEKVSLSPKLHHDLLCLILLPVSGFENYHRREMGINKIPRRTIYCYLNETIYYVKITNKLHSSNTQLYRVNFTISRERNGGKSKQSWNPAGQRLNPYFYA